MKELLLRLSEPHFSIPVSFCEGLPVVHLLLVPFSAKLSVALISVVIT